MEIAIITILGILMATYIGLTQKTAKEIAREKNKPLEPTKKVTLKRATKGATITRVSIKENQERLDKLKSELAGTVIHADNERLDHPYRKFGTRSTKHGLIKTFKFYEYIDENLETVERSTPISKTRFEALKYKQTH